MEKRIRLHFIFMYFIILSMSVCGKIFKSSIPLQEIVKIDIAVRDRKVKQRYLVRFSTAEKKNNFEILTTEKDILK